MGRELHDGKRDGLTPLEPIDLQQVSRFGDLLRAMERSAFGGRQLGMAFDILTSAVDDPSCRLVMTVSGAMTVAKQGKILCDLIDRGVIHAIVATGALIAHGLTESIGGTHYRWSPGMSDEALYAEGYNRIYDTLEMEANLNDVESLVRRVLDEGPPAAGPGEPRVWSSARFCRAVGAALSEAAAGPAILRSAFERGVPVFIPAFTDSELGLDMATWSLLQKADSAADCLAGDAPPVPPFNPFHDLLEYAQWVRQAERLAIWTIGGGVPRNWAQQVGPFFDVINVRTGCDLPVPRFHYGVRICPEPVHFGGLSGCTYSEGVSWGKFVGPGEGGRFAEVHADATTVLPLLAKGLLEWLDERPSEQGTRER